MKVYTKTGDKGITSLYDGTKVVKSCLIFQTIGEIDELSSRIGIACSYSDSNYLIQNKLRKVQCTLQDINSIIATVNKDGRKIPTVNQQQVVDLEKHIYEMEEYNDSLTCFILPGVTQLDAHLHSCRTQTRKCERMLWELHEDDSVINTSAKNPIIMTDVKVDENILKYINRLSDYFFVMARYVCKKGGSVDCFQTDHV